MGNPTIRLAILLLFTIALTASAAPKEPKKKVRLFILAGQTNMKHVEPEEVFTPAVKEAFPDDEIVVTKHAQSGEPIRKWSKQWRPPLGEKPASNNGSCYTDLLNRVKADMQDKGPPTTITFIWMHGEADGMQKGYGAQYGPALEAMILQLQKDFGRQDIDVIIGRLSDHKKGDPEWMAVRKAQEDLATAYPRGAWVDTDDLNGKGDAITYSKEGYGDLAKRFAEKAIEQIKTPKQPPAKRKK